MLLSTIFVCAFVLEKFNVDDVGFGVFLPTVLFDVEHDVVVDLFKIHCLDVRFVVEVVIIEVPSICCQIF